MTSSQIVNKRDTKMNKIKPKNKKSKAFVIISILIAIFTFIFVTYLVTSNEFNIGTLNKSSKTYDKYHSLYLNDETRKEFGTDANDNYNDPRKIVVNQKTNDNYIINYKNKGNKNIIIIDGQKVSKVETNKDIKFISDKRYSRPGSYKTDSFIFNNKTKEKSRDLSVNITPTTNSNLSNIITCYVIDSDGKVLISGKLSDIDFKDIEFNSNTSVSFKYYLPKNIDKYKDINIDYFISVGNSNTGKDTNTSLETTKLTIFDFSIIIAIIIIMLTISLVVIFFSNKKFKGYKSMVATSAITISLLCAAHACGIRTHYVISGSMEPNIPKGSLVISKVSTFDKIKKKDVVIFDRPESMVPVVHRCIKKDVNKGIIVTKGDNNSFEDGETDKTRIKEKVLFHIPPLFK